MSQFLNTLRQINGSESVGTIRGVCRHLRWQVRRTFNDFPCDIPIGNSILHVERPNGVSALVNSMGEYDYNNMNFLRALLLKGDSTFFDIGANIGSYTLIASEMPNAKVVSFEPHPGTFSLLRENVKRNGRSNVHCLNVALSDSNGEVKFTDGLESSINRVIDKSAIDSTALRVPARRLDSICEELNLAPDFIKIDVEGYEEAVLHGFGDFRTAAKMIFIEGGERQEVRNWMLAAHYTGPWFVHLNANVLSPVCQRRPEDPVFVQMDFVPELKRMNFRFLDPRSDLSMGKLARVRRYHGFRSGSCFTGVSFIVPTSYVSPESDISYVYAVSI